MARDNSHKPKRGAVRAAMLSGLKNNPSRSTLINPQVAQLTRNQRRLVKKAVKKRSTRGDS